MMSECAVLHRPMIRTQDPDPKPNPSKGVTGEASFRMIAFMASEFSRRRRIEFAETDMAGIVHFAAFFRFMEETEALFWRSRGCSMFGRGEEGGYGWPKVRVFCEYLAPVYFEDVLETRLVVEKVGERSIVFGFRFWKCSGESGEPEKEIARGELKVACVPMERRAERELKAVPIPKELKEKLRE